MKLKLCLASLLLAGTVSTAQASTITIYSDGGLTNSIATLTSNPNVGFAGFVSDTDSLGSIGGAAQISSTSALAFNLPNAGQSTETTFASNLAETALSFSSRDNSPSTIFTVATGYFALKFGQLTAFFLNSSLPTSLTLTYTGSPSFGLSHVTQFSGPVTQVPGPLAGAGIPALLGLAGLAWARRRKAAGR